jgi:hypothetical protein
MAFQLHVLDTAAGIAAEIEFSDADRDLLELQMKRCVNDGGLELFARWIAQAVSTSLPTVADYELRPPSDAQVNFAMAIVRTLGVALPSDVLKYRGAMHQFLTTHKEDFEIRRKGYGRPTASAAGGPAP